MTFSDHIHRFISCDGAISTPEIPKVLTGNNSPLRITMILFNQIIGVVQKRGILGNILQLKLSQVLTSLTEQEYYDQT